MPTLKNILAQQVTIPMNLEKSIPALPKVSSLMTQLAATVPLGDIALPEIPMMAGAVPTFPAANGITQVIKGIEDALPVGVPKVSEGLQAFAMGGYRPIEEKKEAAKPARRIMGGGYRSMT